MRLKEIIAQARNGEMKGLSAKDKTDEIIVGYINLGLIALYSKFPIRTDEAIIAMKPGKTLYKLDGTDMDVTVGGLPLQEGDVLTITGAYDEHGEIGINEESMLRSIYTPSYNSVQIPVTVTDEYIGLIYKKAPELVSYNDDGEGHAEDTEIDLPMSLTEALLAYVGYKAYGSVSTSASGEDSIFLIRFQNACKEAEYNGVVPQDGYSRDVGLKGFI